MLRPPLSVTSPLKDLFSRIPLESATFFSSCHTPNAEARERASHQLSVCLNRSPRSRQPGSPRPPEAFLPLPFPLIFLWSVCPCSLSVWPWGFRDRSPSARWQYMWSQAGGDRAGWGCFCQPGGGSPWRLLRGWPTEGSGHRSAKEAGSVRTPGVVWTGGESPLPKGWADLRVLAPYSFAGVQVEVWAAAGS